MVLTQEKLIKLFRLLNKVMAMDRLINMDMGMEDMRMATLAWTTQIHPTMSYKQALIAVIAIINL